MKHWNLQRFGVAVTLPESEPELIEVARASTIHAECQRLNGRIEDLERLNLHLRWVIIAELPLLAAAAFLALWVLKLFWVPR